MNRGATIAALVIATYLAAVALLEGPLRAWVPSCGNIVIGFCFER